MYSHIYVKYMSYTCQVYLNKTVSQKKETVTTNSSII